LIAEPGDARFIILTNVAHSVSGGGQADEIDILLIGPTGVHVVEVKHWDRVYVRSHREVVAAEADKLALKARKVASKLRRRYPNLGYVEPKMLLTKEQKTLQRDTDEPISGCAPICARWLAETCRTWRSK
jgi:Nuclease-related domain